jgi:Putative MetA-pathway of phenol degradation
MQGKHCVAFCCGFAVAMISGGVAGEDHSDTATGFSSKLSYDRTVGKYGRGRNTTIGITALTLGYNTDDYSFDVMLPYVRQSGPGRLVFVAGRQPTVIAGPVQNVSGAGDVTSSLTRYLLNEEEQGFDLDLGAIFKLATASASKGLGTGENDFAVQSSLGRSLGGFNTSLTLGYTYVGKPKGSKYQNAFYGTLDGSHHLDEDVTLGLTYSAGSSVVAGLVGTSDITGYVDYKLNKRLKLEAYYLKGLTVQSPDRGAGISLALDF